jgi:histidinol-phosphatase (PHP family)
MKYLCDYHTHSTNSLDGRDTVMDMARTAAGRGFSEIVLTDHFEPVDGNGECKHYKPESYASDIKAARDKLGGIIKIKMGVELGQPHHFPVNSERILNTLPYDYVIGSAHRLADERDLHALDYNNIGLADICEMYLKELKKLAAWGKFDCLGHLDLIKRYAAGTYIY